MRPETLVLLLLSLQVQPVARLLMHLVRQGI
jgi:hypothetical protein